MSEKRVQDTSITVIVPALNEEGNIRDAVTSVLSALRERFARHEILIFDDGSTDRTGETADSLVAENPAVRVIHNEKTRGLGYCYRTGVRLASCEYVVMVPGDNEHPADSLVGMFVGPTVTKTPTSTLERISSAIFNVSR